MSSWWLDPAESASPLGQALSSLAAAFAVEGELVASSSVSRVLRVSLGGKRYYVKHYFAVGSGWWRNLLWPQRVEKEWNNLMAFAGWGIPTARLVAYGQERRWGRFVRGSLVTEELPATMDLAQLARAADPRLKDGAWVAAVSAQLARATRTLHAAGFVHNDLKWRNLLVDRSDPPRLFFIDCPTGGFWWGPFLRYRRVKDLACLDKLAKYHLSRTQRLRFYLDYVQGRRLSAADKKVVRQVLAFFAGRE